MYFLTIYYFKDKYEYKLTRTHGYNVGDLTSSGKYVLSIQRYKNGEFVENIYYQKVDKPNKGILKKLKGVIKR